MKKAHIPLVSNHDLKKLKQPQPAAGRTQGASAHRRPRSYTPSPSSKAMAKQHAAACLAAFLSLPEATMGRNLVSVGVSGLSVNGSPAMRALALSSHTPSPASAGSTEAGAEKSGVLLHARSRDGAGASTRTACFVPPLARPATKLSRTVEPTDQFIERTASLEIILRTLADQARCLRCMQK